MPDLSPVSCLVGRVPRYYRKKWLCPYSTLSGGPRRVPTRLVSLTPEVRDLAMKMAVFMAELFVAPYSGTRPRFASWSRNLESKRGVQLILSAFEAGLRISSGKMDALIQPVRHDLSVSHAATVHLCLNQMPPWRTFTYLMFVPLALGRTNSVDSTSMKGIFVRRAPPN